MAELTDLSVVCTIGNVEFRNFFLFVSDFVFLCVGINRQKMI